MKGIVRHVVHVLQLVKKSFKKILQNDGHYYIAIDPNRCVQCGACEKVCPIINGKDYGNNDF